MFPGLWKNESNLYEYVQCLFNLKRTLPSGQQLVEMQSTVPVWVYGCLCFLNTSETLWGKEHTTKDESDWACTYAFPVMCILSKHIFVDICKHKKDAKEV